MKHGMLLGLPNEPAGVRVTLGGITSPCDAPLSSQEFGNGSPMGL